MIFITAISWFPLLALSIWEGHVWGSGVSLPFLYDIDAHARFLIALPLLLAAELFVHQRMRNVVRQFFERGLIPDSDCVKTQCTRATLKAFANSSPGLLQPWDLVSEKS